MSMIHLALLSSLYQKKIMKVFLLYGIAEYYDDTFACMPSYISLKILIYSLVGLASIIINIYGTKRQA